MAKQSRPEPVATESRICFGIRWYKTEREAEQAHKAVRKRGEVYNGGWFDGMACGRDRSHDKDHPEHGRIYAVTTGVVR